MVRFLSAALAASFLLTSAANASLETGTPSSGSDEPTPRFGTLINFDDGVTNTPLATNQYVSLGVDSIVNTLGPSLGYYATSQSTPNYIGTGFDVGWDADILVTFTNPQAAVGIGIAGPTTLRFELLASDMSLLEGYDVATTPVNTYYYINRLNNDAKYLRVAGDFVAIDDLQFDTRTVIRNPVPEPASWAMMVLGFGALGLTMRRRVSTNVQFA